MTIITAGHIEKGYSYKSFRNMVDDLLVEGKTTSGNNSEFPLLEFTKSNVQRMDNLDKTVTLMPELIEELQELSERWIWIVLAEGWCGDVAQNLPVIAKIAEVTEDIELKILLREENPEVMDAYLTNGGKAVPKLICLTADTMREKGTWGPRPEPVQKMVTELKENQTRTGQPPVEKKNNTDLKELVERYHNTMHKWYDEDKSQTIQKEFLHIVKYWKTKH